MIRMGKSICHKWVNMRPVRRSLSLEIAARQDRSRLSKYKDWANVFESKHIRYIMLEANKKGADMIAP